MKPCLRLWLRAPCTNVWWLLLWRRANTQYNLALLLRPQRVAPPKLGIDTSAPASPRNDGSHSPEPTPETPSIILSTFKNSPYMITDLEESKKVTNNVGLIVAPAVDTKLSAQKRRDAHDDGDHGREQRKQGGGAFKFSNNNVGKKE